MLIPRAITYYVSTALFALFGLKMLHEGYHMSPSEGQVIHNNLFINILLIYFTTFVLGRI